MAFFKKTPLNDKESARTATQPMKESTLTTVGEDQDFDTIESEEDLTVSKVQKPTIEPEKQIESENPTYDDIEAELSAKLEAVRSEKQRILKEQQEKELASQNEPLYADSGDLGVGLNSRVYLSDAECLREILMKLDYLISITAAKK